MSEPESDTARLQPLLDRLADGDPRAAEELILHTQERLRRLTRKMLRERPDVRRWEDTSDVLQNALLRLYRALKDVKPESPRHFLNLAALQIRRELRDLARHHSGPQAHGANHASDPHQVSPDGDVRPAYELRPDSEPGPGTALQIKEMEDCIDRLPEEEREVFSLVHHLGLEQVEVARRLGVSVPTVKRRYRRAKQLLADDLGIGGDPD